MATGKEHLDSLISFIDSRRQYYESFMEYESTFGAIKSVDALDARKQELDFIFWELNRIKNKYEETN